jgi:DNA-binding NtrC family response regulator
MVKQSGGCISITSAPGDGATFDSYLPRTDEKPVVLSTGVFEVRSEYPGGTETILLLEDEDAVRQVTYEFLVASGYNVLQARRGDHAFDLAGLYPGSISLIISDVVLPDMNGPAAVKKVETLHPETKALYVSGHTAAPVAQQLIAEKAMLMQKPVSRRDLLRKVDEILHPSASLGYR